MVNGRKLRIDAGCRRFMGVHDLNFDWPVCEALGFDTGVQQAAVFVLHGLVDRNRLACQQRLVDTHRVHIEQRRIAGYAVALLHDQAVALHQILARDALHHATAHYRAAGARQDAQRLQHALLAQLPEMAATAPIDSSSTALPSKLPSSA